MTQPLSGRRRGDPETVAAAPVPSGVWAPGARVLSVDDRDAPQSVRFEFDVPLGDPTLQLLVWEGDGPVEWNPPSVGDSVRLTSSRTL